ncbi:hypothetical protein PNK_2231 [Candidatus Protochlamydia naegleriophila]|uniref:Protochlamydia outer membrane protein domain-containing protein n=1 Tax=Candidatus Protochlamydia naegleriophila TaxID=389348 RepID=A0A0U5JD85_9BACT|nr:hypothetical protein [Candidatus Protochlamydia naegleriophila]CUI17832.1 hypothetical protein PNK_2231 [Candidatus Protochlamydia naegleriophila]
MFKSLIAFTASCLTALSSLSFATCEQSFELGVGWRRDNLDWKLSDVESSYISAEVDSHIHFKDIEMYSAYAKTKWVGSEYYVRLSADYATSFKGRARETFKMNSSLFDSSDVFAITSDPIKRRSEAYDFDIAVGYPFAFCCNRLNIVPLVGFSYHRQRLKVKGGRDSSHCSSSSYFSPLYSSSDYDSSYDSSYFYSPFSSSISSNPFAEPSSRPENVVIANELGLSTSRRSCNYRFTWYGFYVGTDIAYALDPCWTVYSEIECHFLNNCHRKRKSWTGVYFVDGYHRDDWCYGFNTSFGTTFSMSNCWYATISVDYKWWKSHSHHDELKWQSVGVNAALAYSF